MPDYPRLCPKCDELLGRDAFPVDRSKPSGRKSVCRACHRAEAKRFYDEHREVLLAAKEAKRRAAGVFLSRPRGPAGVPPRQWHGNLVPRLAAMAALTALGALAGSRSWRRGSSGVLGVES
jgi:hypothetical protein